jgi:hypothetical protein
MRRSDNRARWRMTRTKFAPQSVLYCALALSSSRWEIMAWVRIRPGDRALARMQA